MLEAIRKKLTLRRISSRREEREDHALGRLARERRDALIRGDDETLSVEEFFEELETRHPADD